MMRTLTLVLLCTLAACSGQEMGQFVTDVATQTAADIIDEEIYYHTRELDEAFDNAVAEASRKIDEFDEKIGLGHDHQYDDPGQYNMVGSIVTSLNQSVGYMPNSNYSGVYYVTNKPTGPWQVAVSKIEGGVKLDSYGEDLQKPVHTNIILHKK